MTVTLILALSILFQLAAAIGTLGLIRFSGRHAAWVLLSGALILMAAQRSIALFRLLSGNDPSSANLASEGVVLLFSALMFAGIALIRPVFRAAAERHDALRKSEERRKIAQAVIGMGFWDWDIVNNDLFCSDEICGIVGVSDEGFRGTFEALLAAVHPDDRDLMQRRVDAAVLDGADYCLDHRIVLPNEETRIVHEEGEVFRDGTGQAVRMVGAVLDITDRLRAEERESAREQRYRELFESSKDAIYLTKADGKVIEANRAFAELFGYAADELRTLNAEDVYMDCTDRVRFREEMERHGYVKDYEVALRKKDGTPLFCLETATRREIEGGKTPQFEGIIRDISVRKTAEDSLRKANRALRVFSHCNMALAKATSEQGFLETVCKVLVQEGEYRLAWIGVAEHDAERTVRPVAQWGFDASYLESVKISWSETGLGKGPTGEAIRTREPSTVRDINSDPRYGPWRIEASARGFNSSTSLPLLYGGDCLGALNIYAKEPDAFDSTEVFLLGQVAESVAFGIESQRTNAHNDKLEGDLRQAQKMDALGQFAGGIAHDFNNRLAVIQVNSELLRAALGSEMVEERELIEAVLSGVKGGAALIQKLMTFSRKKSMAKTAVDLGALIQDWVPSLRRLLPADVETRFRLESQVPPVHADSSSIEQILLNLATNARDAMPDGGVLEIFLGGVHVSELDVEVRSWKKAGEYVILSVSDTGSGMDEETQQRIFEPFFTTKPLGEGTGLGMPTVFELVADHGGELEVYSKVGVGTTMKVFFPAAMETPGKPVLEEKADVGPQGGAEVVLLVDDDPDLLFSGRRALQRFGYTVIAAKQGEEALQCLQGSEEVDLVITDLDMPGLDGAALFRAAGELGRAPPFVFMSGHPAAELTRRLDLGSEVQFLQKPWTLEQLAKAVRTAMALPPNS